MKKIILFFMFILLIGCNSNVISSSQKNISTSSKITNSTFSTSSEKIIIKNEINFKGFGFDSNIGYEDKVISEESNL